MLKHRGSEKKYLQVEKGNGRFGKSKGHRVWVLYHEHGHVKGGVSVYPEDARKFALELLEMADECEEG